MASTCLSFCEEWMRFFVRKEFVNCKSPTNVSLFERWEEVQTGKKEEKYVL